MRLVVGGVGEGVAGVGGCRNGWQAGTFPITGHPSAAPRAAAWVLQERLSHAEGPCPLAWMPSCLDAATGPAAGGRARRVVLASCVYM